VGHAFSPPFIYPAPSFPAKTKGPSPFQAARPHLIWRLARVCSVSLAGALVLGGTYGYTDPAGTIFTLIQSAGLTGTFTRIPTLTGNWEIVYTADDVLLENPAESGAIPEPAPYWLIGGAIMALGLIRRRRQIAA